MLTMSSQWTKMRKKSKHYKANKTLHAQRDEWANQNEAK